MRWRWVFLALPAAVVAILWLARRPIAPEAPAARPPASTSPPPAAPPVRQALDEQAPALSASKPIAATPAPYPVDLERLRARLPNNVYWKLGVPTDDPEVLRERAEHSRNMNDLYGKVLSGTGTEEEIRAYYDERRRISQDYIELSAAVLSEAGDRLPEKDRGLHELSISMHRDRLAAIPADIQRALARKQEQDRRREAWRGR